MIQFKPVRAEDKEELESYLKYTDSRSCDMPFATIYLWRSFYDTTYAICEGCLVFRTLYEGRVSFSFPVGKEDPGKAILALIDHCRMSGIPCLMHSITKMEEEWLNRRFPGQFAIDYHRSMADYIYETQALIDLRGKKYHGKKNHVNKFMKTLDWVYEEIGPDNTRECLDMLYSWLSDNPQKEDKDVIAEVHVSEMALKEKDFLGLKGGLIRADGQVVAFSLGEEICKDTFCIHIEKAYYHVSGAYAMINQQFLIHEAGDYKYVNREDDVGDPGLRKSKLSYHPAFLLEKGLARYL